MKNYEFFVEDGVLKVTTPMYFEDLESLTREKLHQLVVQKWSCLHNYHKMNPYAMQPRSAIGCKMCAYCHMYDCADCPIGSIDKSYEGCTNTPFSAYEDASTPIECQIAAAAELEFLIGLA